MIGGGPQQDDCLRMIEDLNLSEKVILRDFVHNKDLPDIYQQSSLFVLSSLVEGVPRTILEAMACGIPVACTELPQLVKIVSGCGLLFLPKDPEALAAALWTFMSDHETVQACGRNGRMKAVSIYSWSDAVSKTSDLYSSLIWRRTVDKSRESRDGYLERIKGLFRLGDVR